MNRAVQCLLSEQLGYPMLRLFMAAAKLSQNILLPPPPQLALCFTLENLAPFES